MLVFRRITPADFYFIYQDGGSGGGRQSYIDIDTSGVSIANWNAFFSGITPEMKAGGPSWTFEVNSLGLGTSQMLRIAQRRNSTVSIRAQKLASRDSNRVHAWHPDRTSFPKPATVPSGSSDPQIPPLIKGLTIFIIRATDDTYWAGWMRTQSKPAGWTVPKTLAALFTEDDGFINFPSGIQFDENQLSWPFNISGAASPSPSLSPSPGPSSVGSGSVTGGASRAKTTTASTSTGKRKFTARTEDEVASDLFDADYSEVPPDKKEVVAKVRVRNQKAVRALKKLYGECQITGGQYVFLKDDGDPYLEVHHLIPLGLGGADSPANLVVLSAHMHRMLHYANVGEINLSNISGDQLTIQINGNDYTIRWRPDHAAMIKAVE